MSQCSLSATAFVTAALASALGAYIWLTPLDAAADEPAPAPSPRMAESAPLGIPGIDVVPPNRTDPRIRLTPVHEIAAMDAIQQALDEVPDGATYVWHHQSGAVSAIVRPTMSFRNSSGQVCRHIHLLLNTGTLTRKNEGIACRLASRIWSLEG